MIRSLRQWHGRIWALLAPGALLGLGATVLTRAPEGDTPREARGQAPAVVWAAEGSAPGPSPAVLPTETPIYEEERVFGDAGGTLAIYQRGERFVVRLACERCAADHPDPVVFWASAPVGEGLPSDARLLGGLPRGESSFELPFEGGDLRGSLLLYSLGHARVVGQVQLGGAR